MLRRLLVVALVGMTACTGGGGDGETSTPEPTAGSTEPVPTGEAGATPLLSLLERAPEEGRVRLRDLGSEQLQLVADVLLDQHGTGAVLSLPRDEVDPLYDAYVDRIPEDDALRSLLPGASPNYTATVGDLLVALFAPEALVLRTVFPSCADQYDAYRDELRGQPTAEPTWTPTADGRERWDYPVDEFDAGTAPACLNEGGTNAGLTPHVALAFERSPAGILTVYLGSGDGGPAPVFSMSVEVGDPSGAVPAGPDPPPSAFDLHADFVLHVLECGELPWAFSQFVGGGDFVDPAAPEYREPGEFTRSYACAPEVAQLGG